MCSGKNNGVTAVNYWFFSDFNVIVYYFHKFYIRWMYHILFSFHYLL